MGKKQSCSLIQSQDLFSLAIYLYFIHYVGLIVVACLMRKRKRKNGWKLFPLRNETLFSGQKKCVRHKHQIKCPRTSKYSECLCKCMRKGERGNEMTVYFLLLCFIVGYSLRYAPRRFYHIHDTHSCNNKADEEKMNPLSIWGEQKHTNCNV